MEHSQEHRGERGGSLGPADWLARRCGRRSSRDRRQRACARSRTGPPPYSIFDKAAEPLPCVVCGELTAAHWLDDEDERWWPCCPHCIAIVHDRPELREMMLAPAPEQ